MTDKRCIGRLPSSVDTERKTVYAVVFLFSCVYLKHGQLRLRPFHLPPVSLHFSRKEILILSLHAGTV